jgi:23S rRNA (pseudouridine1915-N3)-methyltransferase
MVKFRILFTDSAKDAEVEGYLTDFIKKASRYGQIEQRFVSVLKAQKQGESERRRMETKSLLSQVQGQEKIIALSEDGRSYTSTELAGYFQTLMSQGHSRFACLVGGAYGLDKSLLTGRADIISLSPLTFTSQLARVVLVEQLYRVLTILAGAPYHKA